MKFAKLEKNESLGELAARLADAPSAAALKRNVALLERANPHVVAGTKDEDGTALFVAVPDGLEGRLSEDPSTEDAGPIVSYVTETARSRLRDVGALVPKELDLETQRVSAALDRLKSSELSAMARSSPALKADLATARARAEARLEGIEALRTIQGRVMEAVAKDLSTLVASATEITGMAASLAKREAAVRPPVDTRARRGEDARRAEPSGARGRGTGSRRREPSYSKVEDLYKTDLPTVKNLLPFLERIHDPEVVRRLRALDDRKTAQPIYEHRITELERHARDKNRRDER